MKHLEYLVPLATLLLLASCGGRNQKEAEAAEDETAVEEVKAQSVPPADSAATDKMVGELPEEPVFDIVTSMGTIRVKLYNDTPKHRNNFARLALSHYFDGMLFHRVINDFMIQGGDPFTRDTSRVEEWGEGGPGYEIPAEFIPEHTHKKGALAAARRGDLANPLKESSGSQFYLVQNSGNCKHLDGAYTVFGETISGLNVIDRIARVKTDRFDRPLKPVVIQRVVPNGKINLQALEQGGRPINEAPAKVNLSDEQKAKADSVAKLKGATTRTTKRGHVVTRVNE
ncbi:MAG: peptidylprolyl isomerase [Bacteroidales bacterium]|nr:peptidylprolyl isomerase [Bacteroidales bacterium]